VDSRTRTLKSSPARSVRLEYGGGTDGRGEAEPRVVKRFAAGGLFSVPRDAARARREHALLTELHACGLPVPRPLSLERRGDGWEVAMQWIPQARTLQERLLAGDTRDLPARALGTLLARLQAAGVDHPDLHPGNVLIDAAGSAWAIDFHKARRGGRPAVAQLKR
jgi:RIO-like serine/threonine protein kinase